MAVKLLAGHRLESLGLEGCCAGSRGSALVKVSTCWKSHATAHFLFIEFKTYMKPGNSKDDLKTEGKGENNYTGTFKCTFGNFREGFMILAYAKFREKKIIAKLPKSLSRLLI